jgi:hypothetical protein
MPCFTYVRPSILIGRLRNVGVSLMTGPLSVANGGGRCTLCLLANGQPDALKEDDMIII